MLGTLVAIGAASLAAYSLLPLVLEYYLSGSIAPIFIERFRPVGGRMPSEPPVAGCFE